MKSLAALVVIVVLAWLAVSGPAIAPDGSAINDMEQVQR